MNQISSAAFADTKRHYKLLDGLRGVAALMVVCYHTFEGFATTPIDQWVNHGYLAVDFFFVLSGFVIGYAYDDRWKTMRIRDFFKRRLVRLHPMVVMGVLIGVVTFCIQGCVKWDGTHVAVSAVMIAMLINLFLIPAVPGSAAEIRGNGEMFPLNGPNWSLFFEYIGNILYALLVRRLSTKVLSAIVAILGLCLALFATMNLSGTYHLGVGWTMNGFNLPGGFLRMAFSYSAGLLLSRVFTPIKIKGAFWICSAVIMALLSMPFVGGEGTMWLNGVYDSVCIMLVFPALVYLAASGETTDRRSTRICKFVGDISYPLYMVHYPLMYLFFAWVWNNKLAFGDVWQVALCLFAGNVVLAYLCLKLYDEPVRRWLSQKFIKRRRT